MRAIALSYKINIDNMGSKDKLTKPTKYLTHSTNLAVNVDSSTEVSHSINSTPESKTFISI